jgi:hypothetical protein
MKTCRVDRSLSSSFARFAVHATQTPPRAGKPVETMPDNNTNRNDQPPLFQNLQIHRREIRIVDTRVSGIGQPAASRDAVVQDPSEAAADHRQLLAELGRWLRMLVGWLLSCLPMSED